MNTRNRKSKLLCVLISILPAIAALTALIFYLEVVPSQVSARAAADFGSACGEAVMDGVVNAEEWSSASAQTFQMISPGGQSPFTATLYVMNSGTDLYMGITINDDEFSTYGEYLPQGDGFRIDFDNDHSGTLFALGDDALVIAAGPPQFADDYIYNATSIQSDDKSDGTVDGAGAASRVADLNHFELVHPLCSGDALDFCLHPVDSVGFRLEYLDAETNGDFGGTQFFPGLSNTSEASIVIGQCSPPGPSLYLPLIIK